MPSYDMLDDEGEPLHGMPAVIVDARGLPVLTLSVGGTPENDNERAQSLCDLINAAGATQP